MAKKICIMFVATTANVVDVNKCYFVVVVVVVVAVVVIAMCCCYWLLATVFPSEKSIES